MCFIRRLPCKSPDDSPAIMKYFKCIALPLKVNLNDLFGCFKLILYILRPKGINRYEYTYYIYITLASYVRCFWHRGSDFFISSMLNQDFLIALIALTLPLIFINGYGVLTKSLSTKMLGYILSLYLFNFYFCFITLWF